MSIRHIVRASEVVVTLALICPAAIAVADATPEGAVIRHVPLGEITTGVARFVFDVQHPERAGDIVIRWRPATAPAATVRELSVRRAPDGWAAVLPQSSLDPPGLRYWVVERTTSGERPVFASAEHPHYVAVFDPSEHERERTALDLRGGRRSLVTASGEYVDFGHRRVRGRDQRFPDRYYRLEASYTYAFFAAVESIRLTVGRVRGEAVDLDQIPFDPSVPAPDDLTVGIDYGGAAITWYADELVRMRTGVVLGFSQRGFEGGAAGELLIGRDHATTFSIGGEAITTLGLTGRARLEWWTVPRMPMGAAIEITSFPSGSDAGVRLLYDVGYVIYPGAIARFRGGYQARTSVTGGIALGGDLALAF